MEKILKFLVSVFLGLICFISYNKNEKNKNYSLKPPFEWYKSLNFGYPGENGTGYVLSETEKSLKLVEIGKNLNSLNEFTCRKISPYSHVFKFYSLVIYSSVKLLGTATFSEKCYLSLKASHCP